MADLDKPANLMSLAKEIRLKIFADACVPQSIICIEVDRADPTINEPEGWVLNIVKDSHAVYKSFAPLNRALRTFASLCRTSRQIRDEAIVEFSKHAEFNVSLHHRIFTPIGHRVYRPTSPAMFEIMRIMTVELHTEAYEQTIGVPKGQLKFSEDGCLTGMSWKIYQTKFRSRYYLRSAKYENETQGKKALNRQTKSVPRAESTLETEVLRIYNGEGMSKKEKLEELLEDYSYYQEYEEPEVMRKRWC